MLETARYAWDVLTTPLRFKEVTAPVAAQIATNTLALYAKDRSGVSSLYFKDDAGVEHDLGALTSAAALTRVDDTNVTLTLGGSPTTALLAATSLTLGWTGQLALSRGGTAANLTAANGGVVYSGAAALAITAAGNSGDWLKSAGAAAPAWAAPAALTKVDDTNVTLTLGGSHATALLNAASLTLGWTGQLAAARGGTGVSALADVTAGSTKISLGGTPTGAVIQAFSIDVNQANLDHGSIGGLSDDDHTGYALLAGRSGGQTLKGGTGSGDDLTLQSTNHATKGSIILGSASAYDEVNDLLGIGVTSPFHKVHARGVDTSSGLIAEKYGTTGSVFVALRSARGTAASPTASQSGDSLGVVFFQGRYGTTAGDNDVDSGVTVECKAEENWSSTNRGAYLAFSTINAGTSSRSEKMRITSDGRVGVGATSWLGFFYVSQTTSGNDGMLVAERNDSGSSIIPTVISAAYNDDSDTNRLSAQCLRFVYTKNSGATAVPSAFDAGVVVAPVFNESMSGNFYGVQLEPPNVASGKTLTTYVGLNIASLAAGAGTVTNQWTMQLPSDATDPTGGGGAATGRIPVLIGGATRYLAYY